MLIPSKSDWGVIEEGNLDAEYAFKQFSGKSLDEAEDMFRDNALYYQEDLSSMPKVVFHFYIQSYMNYILSDFSSDDPSAAFAFISLINWILERDPEYLIKVRLEIYNCLEFIAHNQRWYGADVDIYGNFHNKIGKLTMKFNKVLNKKCNFRK